MDASVSSVSGHKSERKKSISTQESKLLGLQLPLKAERREWKCGTFGLPTGDCNSDVIQPASCM